MLPVKLAAYLDEAAENPSAACDVMSACNIAFIVLRRLCSTNICAASDEACENTKSILKSNSLVVIAISTNIGEEEYVNELHKISKDIIDRAFVIASYFGAKYIKFGVGKACKNQNEQLIYSWMDSIAERSASAGVTPLLDITHNSSIHKPQDISRLMGKHRRWKILYDPAQLIMKRSQDQFITHWQHINQFVEAVDIHDYKIGVGHKPPGLGDAKISNIIKDFQGWYFLKPSLGRKVSTSKEEMFKMAVDAFTNMIGEQNAV